MKKILISLMMWCSFVIFLCPYALATGPIEILVVDAVSGPVMHIGERQAMGWQLAAEEINAKGGILGRKVEIIVADDQLKPEVARRKAQKHIMEGKADIITKGVGSHLARALTDLTKQNNIVFVNNTNSNMFAEKGFSYNAILTTYRASMVARMIVSYLAENESFKRFYLINPDYAYGRDMAAMFQKEIERLIPGAEIVGSDFHPINSKDLSPYLVKVKSTKAECILTGSFGVDLSILMKQRHEFAIKAMVASNALADPVALNEFADVAVGNLTADCWLATVTTPQSKDFITRWKKQFNETRYPDPDAFGARTYMTAQFLFEGIKRAQSTEVNKLIPALEGLRLTTLNGEGYIRPCDHQVQMPYPIAKIVSNSAPYYGAPVMIPADKIEIEASSLDNPRCKQ
jgi:branched-chain amino acid transport system substrate-binding protein